MPQLDRALVKARAAQMRQAAQARAAHWRNSLIGSRQMMLVERDGRTGHATNFARIALPAADDAHIGQVVSVLITGHTGATLTAEIAA